MPIWKMFTTFGDNPSVPANLWDAYIGCLTFFCLGLVARVADGAEGVVACADYGVGKYRHERLGTHPVVQIASGEVAGLAI